MRDPSPLGCLQKSNHSTVPSLSPRNSGILLPFIFIICSLMSLLGLSSISILQGPVFPACMFGDSGTGNGFVTDAFLAQYRGQAHGGIRGDFQRSHPSLPVSSSGHSVGSFSLLINAVASWQPCLRGTSWSREAGSPSCEGNHQRAGPEASQG